MSKEAIAMIGALLLATVMGVLIGIAVSEENPACAYCQNAIEEHADTVICTDGRRYHAECYLRHIEEGDNGKVEN